MVKFPAPAFRHVLWLGGSPCSGKSSISEILAEMYRIQVYHVDDAFQQHIEDFNPIDYPVNFKWTHTAWQDLWMQSQEILLKEAIQCYTEHLQFVFADLLRMDRFVIAEGTSLLPAHIKPLLSHAYQALWVVPTEAFQREYYPKRGPFVQSILSQCADPEKALQTWMDRDVAFANWVRKQTFNLGLDCITVDGMKSIQENAQFISAFFQLDKISC
ncbi:MAG: hypothetical protein P1S60_09630 [Anaerolineae bacterium]|nr:hypothetical protein [Anaerolineae bacterium]